MGKITAILPAFNEEIAIGSMALRIQKYVDRVIVIDDGSVDCTSEVAKLAGAKVIRHSINRGKGAALKTGFAQANGSSVVITIDADGQHNPADIPKMIAPIIAGEADMVIGSRYLDERKNGTPRYRRIGQIVLDTATNLNAKTKITDTQSGFRAFAASSISAFSFSQKGLAIESEMLSEAVLSGLRIREVGIGVRYDVGRSSEHPILHGGRVLLSVLYGIRQKRALLSLACSRNEFNAAGTGMSLNLLRTFCPKRLIFRPTLLVILIIVIGLFMAFAGLILRSISN